MEEVRKPSGRISYEHGTELLQAVDELLLAVEREYPSDRRRNVKVFMEYSEAKQFLGTLLQQVARAIKTSDRALFDEKLGFQGETLVEPAPVHVQQRAPVRETQAGRRRRLWQAFFRHAGPVPGPQGTTGRMTALPEGPAKEQGEFHWHVGQDHDHVRHPRRRRGRVGPGRIPAGGQPGCEVYFDAAKDPAPRAAPPVFIARMRAGSCGTWEPAKSG